MVEFYCFYRYSLIKILNSIQAETIVTLPPGCDMILNMTVSLGF
jgi:hypothetical protein